MVVSDEIKLDSGVYQVKDQILYVRFRNKDGDSFSKKDAQAHALAYKEIREQHGAVPTLIDARNSQTATNADVLRYFTRQSNTRKDRHGPRAYLINSFAVRLLINFYMRMVESKFPIEIFMDEQQALRWLNAQKVN